ncbi:hypothetical protein ACFJIS_14995 [Variovorax boronicumulans]|uniref:hypothetical protein n=1 Tax=Variovorax boronicumulans TaxID=436515 RepID=UPI000F91B839|nr:hypothetical protein [Variovorax boronicumulans]PBI87816.1 hypothetical protein BKP43_38820 [Variovorax boronicumulans]
MKNTKPDPEEARQAAVLKQKADAYVAGMEGEGKGINFDRVPTDRLLIVEALNDWSAGALGEGGSVHFTYSGADPTCATVSELQEMLGRVHRSPALLYPVTGFLLSPDGEVLRYQPLDASYRMTAHSDGSRASAINVAEAKHVSDTDACLQLWLFCATEDCVAYLEHQMDSYGLHLEKEEDASVRRLISGFLQDQFSIGQVRNAIWRSVRHAAALSKRQFFNNAKAAKTIPKQIDKVLTEALGDSSFQAYDRVAATPVGALLMLFRQKFGINDTMPGVRVREALDADAALAPAQEETGDEGDTQGDGLPERVLLRGTLYFSRQYTELDRIALSCIEGVQLDSEAPEWDDAGEIGSIDFTVSDLYAFDGRSFFQAVLGLLNSRPPSIDEVTQRAPSTPEDKWAREAAYRELVFEALQAVGVTPASARQMSWANQYPIDLDELVAMIQGIPFPSGLTAMRVDYARIDGNYSQHKDVIAAGNYTFDFPETSFEPAGDDRAIAASVLAGDAEHLATILATAAARTIRCESEADQAGLLEKVAQKLLNMARETQARATTKPLRTPESD